MAEVIIVALLAGGFVVFFAGRRCWLASERAGFWMSPWSLVAVLSLLIPGFVAAVSESGNPFVGVVLAVPMGFLLAPLIAYHVSALVTRAVLPEEQPPPEPEDPFERAKAAEDRGDNTVAVERYLWLLDREPAHIEARVRLARLFAETGRIEQALEALDKGLALKDMPSAEKAEWRALRREFAERHVVGDAAGGVASRHPMGRVHTARMDAHDGGKDAPEPPPVDY